MTKEEILNLLQENMYIDHRGKLQGHEDVANDIAMHFMHLELQIERLRKENSDMGWRLNPDRMGGSFSDWETKRRGDEWS